MDLVTAEMVSSMSRITLEKVFEETFSVSPPLYAAFLVGRSITLLNIRIVHSR